MLSFSWLLSFCHEVHLDQENLITHQEGASLPVMCLTVFPPIRFSEPTQDIPASGSTVSSLSWLWAGGWMLSCPVIHGPPRSSYNALEQDLLKITSRGFWPKCHLLLISWAPVDFARSVGWWQLPGHRETPCLGRGFAGGPEKPLKPSCLSSSLPFLGASERAQPVLATHRGEGSAASRLSHPAPHPARAF